MAVDFTDQKEAEEYVKRIGIEYRFGCYQEKSAEACHLLAEYLQAVEVKSKDSADLFKKNCEENKFGPSCHNYGRLLVAGKDCERNAVKAFWAFSTSCAAKYAPGCLYQGLLMRNGMDNLKPDPNAAFPFMQKACEMGDGKACYHLSGWYYGDGKAEKKDMEKAIKYGIMACERGIPHSCSNISSIYASGKGHIEKNTQLAEKYKQMAKDITSGIGEKYPLQFTG